MRCFPLCAVLAFLACAAPARRSGNGAVPPGDLTADRAELLRLHERARAAHLERRADWLVSDWADSLVTVNHGQVSVGSAAGGREGFQRYFDGVEFQAWDDIVPPRVRISPDGRMAYVIVEKRVHLTPRETPDAEPERTRFAWLSVYEKIAGRWRLAAIASTERPDSL